MTQALRRAKIFLMAVVFFTVMGLFCMFAISISSHTPNSQTTNQIEQLEEVEENDSESETEKNDE